MKPRRDWILGSNDNGEHIPKGGVESIGENPRKFEKDQEKKMVYTYRPANYTSLQDSITSICKTILPFSSFKKRRLPMIPAAEQQSDNLKWQQDSFHHMLHLMGLCKEGIVPENEVTAFRTHLLETLIASPIHLEPPLILRDKLIFLQELLYAKCIGEEEYHASKRPLLQRLAVQGAEIDVRDVIVGVAKEVSNEEWCVIDLKDEKCLDGSNLSTLEKNSKESSAVKRMKGAASVFGFVSSKLKEKNVRNESGLSEEYRVWNSNVNEKEMGSKSILMEESLPPACVVAEKQSVSGKRKPFRTIFWTEQGTGGVGGGGVHHEKKERVKQGKRGWVLKKWKRNDSEDETASLSSLNEKPNEASYVGKLVANPVGEGPDTRQIKRKLHPNGAPTDFFVDKVLAESIKKQLLQIKTEFAARNPEIHLTDDQIEAISTRLPVDKADLERFFSKSWCDQFGDVVLDVVRKEFKDHMREMGNQRGEKHDKFETENSHPNYGHSFVNSSSIDKGFKYNPFFDI